MWSFENFGFVRDIRTKIKGKFILDLYLTIIVAVLMLVLTYTPIFSNSVLRVALAFPVTLFAPGYALVAALFPRKKDMGSIARVTLSFSLSVIIVPLIGFGLNYTPLGVRLDPILACVTIFTIACSGLAMWARFKVPEEELFYPDFHSEARTLLNGDKSKLDRAFTAAILIALALSAGLSAYLIVMPRQGESFTEFYLLGPEHATSGYPKNFVVGEQQPVTVCVANHERREVPYDIVVRLIDNTTATQLMTEHLVLEDNQTWEKMVNASPDRSGTHMNLEFSLYRDGEMEKPYQQCRLWINATDGQTSAVATASNASSNATAEAR